MSSITDTNKQWLRNTDIARYLGVSPMTVWRWQRSSKLNFPKPSVINTVSYTPREALDAWLRMHVVSRLSSAPESDPTVSGE
jgi:predicted DNA-binding transcriptional regulator AlpA